MVSRLAPIMTQSMRQTCTVSHYTGADPTGQPIYGTGVEWPCRIAIRTKRTVSNDGDWTTNSGVRIILPADCDIEAYDRIDLPEPYAQGAIIAEVTTATDIWGETTHKVVGIA